MIDTPTDAQAQLFGEGDLLRDLELLGGDYRLSRGVAADAPLLSGRQFQTRSLQPGLVLHAAEVTDLCDMDTWALQQPGIKLTVLVSGSAEVAYGRRRYALEAGQAALVALAEPDLFHRRWRCGRSERKLSLTLRNEWLEQAGFDRLDGGRGLLQAFAGEHMAECAWVPSAQALLAAERVLAPPPLTAGLQALYVEARCLDIVIEALAAIAGASLQETGLSERERRQLARLQELLDSGAADEWTLQRIAVHVGSNPTTLQRIFRSATGTTIFDYQRRRRLQQAHAALCRDRVGVEQAAAIAGYSSAANFATAFKRQFGMTPRQARASRFS